MLVRILPPICNDKYGAHNTTLRFRETAILFRKHGRKWRIEVGTIPFNERKFYKYTKVLCNNIFNIGSNKTDDNFS